MIYTVTDTIGIHRHIGVPAKLGRVWLDILVPPGPPPEYEQSGYVQPVFGKYRAGMGLTCEQLGNHR